MDSEMNGMMIEKNEWKRTTIEKKKKKNQIPQHKK